jgi:glycosyltransferase involved in cell wall biosynthesis
VPGNRDMIDVSVLTPTYQYGHFLPDALVSVATQTGVSVEHVVQDGGSTDDTLSLLAAADPPVSWRSEPDRGIGDAMNRALHRAHGRWIAWLNADEFYLPGALAALVNAAESAGADAAYGDRAHVDEDGRLLRLVAQHPFDKQVLWGYGTYIPTCAFIVRREALREEPWDPSLRGIAEYPLYLKLATDGARFAYIPRALGAYRVHEGQDCRQPLGDSELNRERIRAEYGLPYPFPSRSARTRHRMMKLRSGAYLRELAWLRRRGNNMRWFVKHR